MSSRGRVGCGGRRGDPYEAIVIAVIVIANGVLGFVQERQAEDAVAALQRMAGATAGVLRDNRETRVATEGLVPGDILGVPRATPSARTPACWRLRRCPPPRRP